MEAAYLKTLRESQGPCARANSYMISLCWALETMSAPETPQRFPAPSLLPLWSANELSTPSSPTPTASGVGACSSLVSHGTTKNNPFFDSDSRAFPVVATAKSLKDYPDHLWGASPRRVTRSQSEQQTHPSGDVGGGKTTATSFPPRRAYY